MKPHEHAAEIDAAHDRMFETLLNKTKQFPKELCRVSMNKDGVITVFIHWDVSFETAAQLVEIMGKAASNAKS